MPYNDRLVFEEKDAFWLFSAIMLRYGISNLYSNDFFYFEQDVEFLKQDLSEKNPDIMENIKNSLLPIGLDLKDIFHEIYLTLFMYNIDLDSSAIILD